mgnify:CR=1 FL=1
MKSFQTFLFFWFLPLLIIFPVIIIQQNDSLWSVLNSKITFFTIIYFAIISFSSTLFIKQLEKKIIEDKRKILLSILICFALVFVFSICLNLILDNNFNLFPPFFQGLIAVGIFLIEYFILSFLNRKSSTQLELNYNKFFYFKLLVFVFLIDFECKKPMCWKWSDTENIFEFNFDGVTNQKKIITQNNNISTSDFEFNKTPISFKEYKNKFDQFRLF